MGTDTRTGKLKALALLAFVTLLTVTVVDKSNERQPQKPRKTSSSPNTGPPNHSVTAKVFCTEVLKSRLKAPATAEFSRTLAKRVTSKPTEYVWDGHVDSQNAFGAMLRTEVSCHVRCTDMTTCEILELQMHD